MKICARCKQEKARFPRDIRRKDGLSSWCSDCFAVVNRARYKPTGRRRGRPVKRKGEARVSPGKLKATLGYTNTPTILAAAKRGDREAMDRLARLGVVIR